MVVAHGRMAGSGTVVSRASLFMSDVFTVVPYFMSYIITMSFYIYVIYYISRTSALAPPLFVYDNMSSCAAVLSAIRAERSSLMSDTIAGRVTVPDAGPAVVRERVRPRG